MADASSFPVTELFGCQPGYPLNQNLCPAGQGFHKGIDYGCPVGTPIVVNGVMIGISGATGEVTGPHVHVGKWLGGTVKDPGVGNGWHFNSAVVSDIGEDAVNGKYVKVQADGFTWVYLHMSNNKLVTVGQVLQGEDMIPDEDNYFYRWVETFQMIRGRTPTRDEFRNNAVGLTWLKALELLEDDPEAQATQNAQNTGQKAIQEDWQGQIVELKKQLAAQGTVLKPGKYTVN